MNAAGDFVVTWSGFWELASMNEIYGQRFDATGIAQGGEFQVNTYTFDDQRWSDVAIDDAGDFVVTWTSWLQDGEAANSWAVVAKRYDALGNPQGAEFVVNTYTPLWQQDSNVAMDAASGRFVITWTSWTQEPALYWNGWGQYAQAYAADGTPDGAEFLVNTTTELDQKFGDVTWGGGNVVMLWSGNGTGDGDGVFTQRYTANSAPTITSAGAASVPENTTAVMTVTANDVDGDPLTYSIAGGADAALFAIDANSGALSFVAAPNYEAHGDSNHDNVYDVTVRVSDGALTATQAVAVTVTDVNEAPSITSGGAVTVLEQTTAVMTVAGADPDAGATLTYSISGGADAAKFAIDGVTGDLSFLAAPNFAPPGDSNADNVYDVTVQVSDGALSATKAVAVTVSQLAPPVITSAATAAVAENTTAAMTVTALPAYAGALAYSIEGGADAAKFNIDSVTGVLSFVSAPDYENPGDCCGNNEVVA